MAQLIQFEGVTHEFPDDATDDDIAGALNAISPAPPRELPTLHGAENYQPPTPAPPAPPPEPLANLGDNPDGTVNPTPTNPAMGGFGASILRALGTPETPPPQTPGFVDPSTGVNLGGTVNEPTPENPANAGIENIGRQAHDALQSLRLPGEPTAEQHRAADAAAGNLIPPPGGMGPDRSIERLQRAADQNSRSLADQIAPENRAAIAEAQGGNIPPVERPQWSPEEMRARGIALPPASAIDWAYQLANLVGRGAAYTPISALRTPETFLDMIHEQQRRLMEMGRHVLTLDDAQANSVLRWARQTLGDRAGNFTRDFVALRRGEISPAEFQQTLGDLLETSNWWRAARLASQSFVDRNLPVSPEAAQSILGQIAQGMGSSIGGVLLHMLPGGMWLAGAAFTGAGVDEAVQRAINGGASNEQIIRSMLGGGISGGTDLVELEILMRPFAINRGAYAFMLGTARRMVEQGVTEGIQEGVQELIQNLNEGRIYNPQRRAWENVADSAALGAAVGAIMGGVTAPMGAGRGTASGDVSRPPRDPVVQPEAQPTAQPEAAAEQPVAPPSAPSAEQPSIALPEPAPTFGVRQPTEPAPSAIQEAEQPIPPAAVTPTGAVAEPETQQAPIPPAPVTALPIEEQTAQIEALPAAQQVAAQAAAVPTVAQAMPSARVAEPAAQAVPFPLDAPAPDPRTIPRPQLIALQQQYGPELVSVLFDNPNVGNPNFTLRAALQEAESARLARNPVSPAPAPAQVQPDAQRAPVEAPPAPPDSPPPGGPAATIRRWGGLSEAERADMRRIAPALRDAMLARTISPTPDAVAEHFGVTPNVAYVALRSLAGRSYSGVTFVRGDTPDNARFRYGPRQSTADRVGWERDKNRAAMERAARELDLEYGPNTSDADLERALIEAAAKHTENQAAAEAEVEAERRLILEAEQIMAEAAPETYNDVPFDIGPDEAQVQPVQSDASGADRPVGEQRPEPSEPAAKSARGADQGGAQGARTAAISPGSAERTKAGRAGPVSTDTTGRSGTTEPAGNADAGRGERKPNRDTGARAGADTGSRVNGAPGPDVPFERPAPQPGETREIDGLTARRYEDGWSIARKAERGPNWIRESHRPGNTPAEALANYRSYEGAKRQESATAQANQAAFDAALAKVRAGTETDADLRALTRFGNYSISTQPAIGLLRELGLRAGDARRALNGLVSRISAGGAEIYDVRDVVARARRNSGGLFERPAVFYSALTRAAETAKITKGTPDQWLATLRNTPGVKQDEIDWSGLDPWLRQQTGSVTREAVTDFLRANEVRVEEVTKGGKAPAGTAEAIDKWLTDSGNSESENRAVVRDAVNGDAGALAHLEGLGIPSELLNPIYAAVGDGATKFHSYALPGGENYRELLLTLPDPGRIPTFEEWYEKTHISPLSKYADDPHMMAIFRAKYESEAKNFPREGLFRRSHWDEPNVLAHVRFSDRTDADGKKVLLVDEVQSDWHQQGRAKGYAGDLERSLTAEERELRDLNAMSWDGKKWTPEMADRQHELTQRVGDSLMEKVRQFGGRNVPDAPFKTQWPELAMKRMLRWAAEHGYDRLAWTPGEVQAERYDLSKQISRIALFDLGGGRSTLRAYDHENRAVIERDIADPQRELPDLIGKDATEKLLAQEPLRPKLIEKLSATDISIEPGEHGWVISAPDGRRVEIGRGTVENEAAARDYGLRYLNQKAEGINAGRRAAAPGPRELRGLDLKVGGEGMRGFYDKMLPAAMNRYVKKWGARVGTTTIEKPGGIGEWRYEGPTLSPAEIRAAAKTSPHGTVTVERTLRDIADAVERGEAMPRAVEKFGSYAAAEALGGELIDMPTGIRVHSLDITPAMRASVMQGQPMWRREGSGTSEGEAQPINDTLRARSTPEWTNSSARQKAVRVLLRTLKRKAPQANLVVSENLEGRVDGEPDWFRVTGAYDPVADLVAVALNREATDTAPEFTLDHEILHHLKRSGLITDAEWSALERAAKDNGWITQELRDRYPGASESLLTEEAIADAYARWSQDRNPKGLTAAVVRMFRRIQEFFRGLRSDLRGAGITAESVFRAIEGGKVGARREAKTADTTAFHAAWHGSRSDHDRFSTDHIGTGEGAQAYGWGLYFAGKRGVAEHYRRTLTRGINPDMYFRGERLDDQKGFLATHIRNIFDEIDAGGNFEAALEAAIVDLESRAEYEQEKGRGAVADEARKAAEKLGSVTERTDIESRRGRLYQVDLAPKEHEYLDWDLPLSEQSDHVKKALAALPAMRHVLDLRSYKLLREGKTEDISPLIMGRSIYQSLAEHLGYDFSGIKDRPATGRSKPFGASDDKAASLMLAEAGIPGIRYLDEKSRDNDPRHIRRMIASYTNILKSNTETLEKARASGYDDLVPKLEDAIDDAEMELAHYTALLPREADRLRTSNYVIFEDHNIRIENKFQRPKQSETNQTVLPGAEAISDKELAERRMAERGTQKQKGKVAKDIEDTPLFDTGARKQGSLFERVPPLLPPAEPPSRSPLASAGHRIGQAARALASSVVQDVKMNLAPMAATKSEHAQAAAKDFANWDRLAHAKLNMIFEQWKKRFTPDRLNAMWQALNKASEDSLAGDANPESALNILNPEERAEVERLTEYGKALWARAEAAGVVQKGAEGIPFYATRIAAKIGLDGKLKLIENTQGIHALDTIGRNLTTKGTDRRIYATADEAERAMKAMFGPDTVLVRNILALPIAFARMERAIAGKNLIQAIKEYGEQSGFDAVNTQGGAEFFTLDHPAFKQYRPRFNREDDGTITAVKDENGDQILDTTSIYVHRDFEGPLRAVLTANKPGAVYNGLMRWKAAATQMIMFSPTIHLAVEFARALPLKPGKMITLRLFRDGYKAKNDEAQMREAILSGLAPIANRGLVADITDTQAEPAISDATGKVISAAKKFSKFWHQTLLWDRIADLQYGIWKTVRDDMMAKGIDRQTASRTAAHLANRYAGALPREAMSGWATKVANVAMFSRSFTLGNLGVFKDMLNGMPEDFRAQIERDAGKLAAVSAQSFARRKAIGAFAIDIALFMAGNALLQMGFSALRGDDWDEIQRGYVRRFHSALRHIGEHPWESLFGLPGSIFHSVNQLLPQGDNEPGKQDRILVGYDSHGRGIYMRSPISKIGEEFLGWMTRAREMALAKESTMLRPIMETLTNDRGFGRQVYNPNDPTLLIIGNVVTNLVRSQLPMSMIEAGRDMLGREGSTRDRTVAALQTFGPFAGLMFSQGHPAGPIGAEIAAQSQEHQAAIRQAMPDINRRLRAAMEPQNEATRTQRLDAAIQEMTALGMSRGQIRRQMQIAGSPDAVVSRSRVVQAYRTANPEQRQRLDLLFGRTAE